MVWMPVNRAHVIGMALERRHLGHGTNVVQLDHLISRCSGHQVAVFAPLHGLHRPLVSVVRCEIAARPWVPELDEIVLAPRHDQALVRMPVDTLDIPSVTLEALFLSRFLKRPNFHCAVVTCAHEPAVVGTEAEVANSFPMRRKNLQVVHVGLKVLDHASLIGREDPGARFGVLQGANCVVVRLQNRLKVERQAVPKGEFATGRAREQPATLGCPLQREGVSAFSPDSSALHTPIRTRTMLTGHRILFVDECTIFVVTACADDR